MVERTETRATEKGQIVIPAALRPSPVTGSPHLWHGHGPGPCAATQTLCDGRMSLLRRDEGAPARHGVDETLIFEELDSALDRAHRQAGLALQLLE